MRDPKLIPIGTVGVDTGRLLIIDPAHLHSDETQTLLRQLTSEAGLEDTQADQPGNCTSAVVTPVLASC